MTARSEKSEKPARVTRRQDAELELYQAITQELLSTLHLEELLWKVVRVVARRLGFDFVCVALFQNERELLFRAAHGGGKDEERLYQERARDLTLPVDTGLTGRAVHTGQTVLASDVSTDPDYVAVDFLPDTRSELCVPVSRGGRVLGVIDAQSAHVDAFDETVVQQLERVASLVGLAIDNATAHERLEKRNQQLQLSEAVSRIAVGAVDVQDLASRVSVKLREHVGVEYVGVSRFNARDGALELAGSAAEPGFLDTPKRRWRLGEGLLGRVGRTRCTLVFDAAVEATRDDALSPQSQSEIAVPLTSAGKVVGGLHLASREPGFFEPTDAQVLEAVAGPIAHALANAVAMDRLEQLRSELSGMIVHDLRNPLMVVLTALRVLERVPGVQEDARCQRYLRNAGVAGDEVLRMVGSLLDLQKLESGELSLQCSEFSLADVVQRVVVNHRILAEVEEVELSQQIDAEVPAVTADLDLVLRAVENLVGNAVKFTPSGGEVRVAVRRAHPEELAAWRLGVPEGVLVEVVDSGDGIPAEDQERIFEKFGVVESRKRRVKVSTGLGLAMCKLVVTTHGGRIWVDSEVGKGARFAFILPVKPAEASSVDAPETKSVGTGEHEGRSSLEASSADAEG